jgi:uncharacterized phage protein gp47/JayE
MSGLTNTGFEIKTFEDIRTDIETVIKDKLGTINLNDESVISQLIGIFIEPNAKLWLALQAINSSTNPDTATGLSLDSICQQIGISRLIATATTVKVELTGVNQTLVTAGNEITGTGVNATFRLDNDVTISNSKCVDASIVITSDGFDDYTLNINDTVITYTKFFGESKEIILDNLISLINDADIGISASNVNEALYLKSDSNESFSIYITTGMNFTTVTSQGMATCTLKGEIFAASGSLQIIRTPVFGWLAVNNFEAGLTGRNLETDNELRLRRSISLKRAGAGTVDAIIARILDVTGVISVSLNENFTNVAIGGLPPHSFETLVTGGTDIDIGNAIWRTRPTGIETIGNVSVTVKDINGVDRIVKFSRAVKLYIFVRVTLTKADNNTYPANGDNVIKNDILNKIRSLKIGETVVYQSFYNSIYKVGGIISALVEIGSSLNESPTPALSANNVTVSPTQIAITDLTKIEIIDA